jgi:hypothetical protein
VANGPADYRGKPYDFTVDGFDPDHLAVLENRKGACGVKDGCGILARNESDDPEPTNDRGTEMSAKLNADEREKIIANLVANCDCGGVTMPWKGKDRAALNGASDELLAAWEDVRKALAANAAPAPAPNPPQMLFWNPARGAYEALTAAAPVQPAANAATPAPTPPPAPAAVPVATPAPPARPRTNEEWLAMMPPAMQPVWNSVMEQHARHKADLVERLVENHGGDAQEQARLIYAEMDPQKLEALVAALPPRQDHQQRPVVANWLGASGAPPPSAPIHEEPLPTPKYNFAGKN